MTRLALLAALTTTLFAAITSSAFAWSGGSIDLVSCPEIHFTAPPESGPWEIKAVEGTITAVSQLAGKTVLYDKTVAGFNGPQIVGGFYLPDNASHVVTVVLGNAANIADGFKYKTVQMTGCAPPAGTPGPAGPPGPPGPKGDPGPPGKGVASCTSHRVYHVRVGSLGKPISLVRFRWDNNKRHATARPGKDGRIRQNVSFRNVVSPLRGVWTINMNVHYTDGSTEAVVRVIRLCAPSDGNLNVRTDIHADGA